MPQQLHFDLPHQEALGIDDYFVSGANRDAEAMIADDARWPEGRLAVVGPKGSGKTHLARLWQARTGASLLDAAALDPGAPLPPPGSRIALEDMDKLSPGGQEYAFHLHNHLKATDGRLLLTATCAPSEWPIPLADLASRMQAAMVVPIRDPDDALLLAVLTKHFADRQLNPPPSLIAWLLRRMERSFEAAARIVAQLDRASLDQGRVINQSLARGILDNDLPNTK